VERGKKDSYQSMSGTGTGKVKRRVLRHRFYSEGEAVVTKLQISPYLFLFTIFFLFLFTVFFFK
jgi:hypothetical protein